jgi:probable rRNA maturation factor
MIEVSVSIRVKTPLTEEAIIRAVAQAARYEKKIKKAVEIQVIGDKAITKLNHQYRGLNKPTDVLSFSWVEDPDFPAGSLGQIYISYPQIVRQAPRFKVSPVEEFYRMLTHGLLHLVGYDHLQELPVKKMFALQEKIVTAIMKSL